MINHSTKVFIGVEQRLDALAGRQGSWPNNYVRLTLEDGNQTHRINVSVDVAATLAKGLNKAVRMARS